MKFSTTISNSGNQKNMKEFLEDILLGRKLSSKTLKYKFSNHTHPFSTQLTNSLLSSEVIGLQGMDTESVSPNKLDSPKCFFEERYQPNKAFVTSPHPVLDIDFSFQGAYSNYNWEIFYHIPLMVAQHLTKNQKFEEARKWLHYIFDPTDNSNEESPQKFWKVKPFKKTDMVLIEDLLATVGHASSITGLTEAERKQLETLKKKESEEKIEESELLELQELRKKADDARQESQEREGILASIDAWRENPFEPHVVAEHRISAYMMKAVMAYLDNLIAWGDAEFGKDNRESLNEATQYYMLASSILGEKPQAVPKRVDRRSKTYEELKPDLDAFGNALSQLEGDIDLGTIAINHRVVDSEVIIATRSLTKSFYFCIPRNEKLLRYWDTVADRLFKLRNSLSLQGKFRQLALFQPPIDPALLARARASGLSVNDVVSSIQAAPSNVRFLVLINQAKELVNEVKSAGSSLLSAIEKGDAEELSQLRSKHEQAVLSSSESLKFIALQDAIKAKENNLKGLDAAISRYSYFEGLLGKSDDELNIPSVDSIDMESLRNLKFSSTDAEVGSRTIDIDIAEGAPGGRMMSSYDKKALELREASQRMQDRASGYDNVAASLGALPAIRGEVKPLGAGSSFEHGGPLFSRIKSSLAGATRGKANRESFNANRAQTMGSHADREREWAFQSNNVGNEITQMVKNLRSSELRVAAAKIEWENHQQQIKDAEEIDDFLKDDRSGKKAGKDLYLWMQRETRGVYVKMYELAMNVAKKAEMAYKEELDIFDEEPSFIKFSHMTGAQGLLAGEKLALDLRNLENAYIEKNSRRYEIEKSVSLLDLDNKKLNEFKVARSCTFTLPDSLFDKDFPGQYCRRIKSVAVTIPCITGPYTSVNCRLTLLDGYIFRKGIPEEKHIPRGVNESIITSSARNDTGMFETNLNDERYLKFEGAGASNSKWKLEIPGNMDLAMASISDVILTIKYTSTD